MKLAKLALALVLAVPVTPSYAQSEPPSTPITVGQAFCGAQVFNCYSVPLTIGGVSGTAWMYPQWNGGFILFRPNLEGPDYVTAQVTSWIANQRNSIGQVTQFTITYTINSSFNGGVQQQPDPDNNGDTDVVMGSVTLNLKYTRCSGRCGGYLVYVTGGYGAQSITQD